MIARAIPVPKDALLHRYVGQAGTYTDCFEVMHPLSVTHADFIEAFYTTWLFRLERVVLSIVLRRRVRDADVAALAQGTSDSFAVWTVEARDAGQILLRDSSGYTGSYLAVAGKEGGTTRLIFGSVLAPEGGGDLPFTVRAMIPLHVFYSKMLLRTAEWKLRRS
jgi:hypothetical protein